MTEVFRAGSQLIKVRMIMALAAASAAASIWFGWVLLQTYGLSPGDGGVLAPFGQRLAWFLGLSGLGLTFLAGMWAYAGCYVSRMAYDPRTQRLHLWTLTYWGTREEVHEAAGVQRSTFHGGRLINPAGVSVKAPWHYLYLARRGLPAIIDGQGEFLDPLLAGRLMKAR